MAKKWYVLEGEKEGKEKEPHYFVKICFYIGCYRSTLQSRDILKSAFK